MRKDIAKPKKRRRHDRASTRAQILAAAQELFGSEGYEGVSLRQIASVVGLDAAMVIRHFGSKDRLFAEAMPQPELLRTVLANGDRATMAERMVRYSLSLNENSREYHMLVALLRSASQKSATAPLTKISHQSVQIVADFLEGENRETRAALICSHLTGIFVLRSIFGNSTLSSCEVDELTARTTPAIQALVDPQLT